MRCFNNEATKVVSFEGINLICLSLIVSNSSLANIFKPFYLMDIQRYMEIIFYILNEVIIL